MTTAIALWRAARDIFSLNVQFPLCSKAIHCLILGGTRNRVWGSQPRWSATKWEKKIHSFFSQVHKQKSIKSWLQCSVLSEHYTALQHITARRAMDTTNQGHYNEAERGWILICTGRETPVMQIKIVKSSVKLYRLTKIKKTVISRAGWWREEEEKANTKPRGPQETDPPLTFAHSFVPPTTSTEDWFRLG